MNKKIQFYSDYDGNDLALLEIEKHKVLKIIDEIRKRDIALWIIPDES